MVYLAPTTFSFLGQQCLPAVRHDVDVLMNIRKFKKTFLGWPHYFLLLQKPWCKSSYNPRRQRLLLTHRLIETDIKSAIRQAAAARVPGENNIRLYGLLLIPKGYPVLTSFVVPPPKQILMILCKEIPIQYLSRSVAKSSQYTNLHS